MNRTRDTAAIGRTENGDKWHFTEDTCHLMDTSYFVDYGEITYIVETDVRPLGGQETTIDIRDYELEDLDESLAEPAICNTCIHTKQQELFR